MSKQLNLKFKKILKQADYTHADLEYHEQLLPEAKQNFADAITKIINEMDKIDQDAIREADRQRQEEFEKELNTRRGAVPPDDEEEASENPEDSLTSTDTEIEEAEGDEKEITLEKESELKNLFRRIAALTHPDKAAAKGISKAEKLRLRKIFMSAKKAYDEGNWYILYSIAIELDILLSDPCQENIKWVEEDIKATMAEVSRISGTVVWVWYVGDEAAKLHALKSYFQQNYGLDLIQTND